MSSDIHNPADEQFRDKISTVDKSGKRIWIYPKKPSGKFTNYRIWLSYLFLIILFGLPFIKVNGEPFVLFNILERNFILFGIHFGPQDFYLFAIAMLILLVFIILFTVIFGRLFCGWICPQTVFMELVYRRIEYAIDGDYNAQKKLDAAPWTADKIIKRVSKQAIFFGIAVLISNTFLAYIIGLDDVVKIIQEPVAEHMGGFIAMIIFSFAFYIVFARLREQVCTTICPYGRLQGVMLDNKSLVVAYDFVRGEPRGKIQKNKTISQPAAIATVDATEDYIASVQNKLGDCIDCKLCIHVCPTGIDIRNGTQLECVNCTACMDACDEVMEKIDRPKGLIRIDSIEGITKKENKLINPRSIAYTGVLLGLIILEVVLFSLRSDVEVLLLRTGGLLSQENADGTISNLYNYQMINKTNDTYKMEFRMLEPSSGTFEIVGGKSPSVEKNNKAEGALFIKIPKGQLEGGKNKIVVGVYSEGKLVTKVKTTFFGPIK
ncbi:MAG: cytochrome c oxidase accessory protein CcoG [Saprospiraceae bacterium]|jgi:cytochrome c oxidase accessory protein FixG|nr:cytochrome c oxidase accessory protein CcoG [Saprospiraceae bacterium]